MDISKSEKQDLENLLKEATTANQTEEAWIKKFLDNLKTILLKEPARYRAFGPYWWILKKAYIDRGDLSFGEFVDMEWLEAMDYGNQAINIMAAFVYEELRTTTNMIDDPFHEMENSDGSDSVEFASSDPEMEIMALG